MTRKVQLDVERWEVLGRDPMTHWCFRCKRMHEFRLDEASYTWYNGECGGKVLLQQLIIEGLVAESKYRGIENA